MENRDKLSALAWAAHERGITYGELMAQTTELDRENIYDAYRQEQKWRAAKRPKKHEAPPVTVILPDPTKRRPGETKKEFRSRRVREGMEAAKAKGARLGRPPLTPTLTPWTGKDD